jgi:hypothetical protein
VEAQLAESRPARVWPWALTGVGAATLIAGGVLGAVAMNRHRSAADKNVSQLDAQTLQAEAERLAAGANIAFAAGTAITIAGVIWLLWPEAEASPRPRVEAWLSPTGAGAFLRF